MIKMYILVLIIIIVNYSRCQYNNNSGRSYYFKMGKAKNEFRVNNRIYYLNHNITDYDYTHKRVDDVQNRNYDLTYYIDEEWNFDHENIVKAELPMFIHKLHEKMTPDDNTIRILFNENRNSSSNIIKFNLETLKSNEVVLDADFYFFLPIENTSEIYRQSVVLRLYQFEKQVQNNSFNESTLIENPDIHKLFNVIYISKAQKGWQIFKIKKPIDNWLNGEDNLGLLLTISSYDDNKLISVFNDTNEGVLRSFALITVQNNDTLSVEQEINNKEIQITVPSCQRNEWLVSFKKLHWDRFIIAPEGFVAYDCSGKCSSAESDTINHVKFLRIFHKRPSCCVPVKYLPLPLMYYDKFGNIVIKNYENMIVAECGCR